MKHNFDNHCELIFYFIFWRKNLIDKYIHQKFFHVNDNEINLVVTIKVDFL